MKYVFGKQNIHTRAPTYLQISAIALLSLLHVSVSTFLSSVEHLHLRHVEQTHAHSFLQTRREILLTARTEDCRERIPERKQKYYLDENGPFTFVTFNICTHKWTNQAAELLPRKWHHPVSAHWHEDQLNKAQRRKQWQMRDIYEFWVCKKSHWFTRL